MEKNIKLSPVGIDSHAHLDLSPLNKEVEKVLERAYANSIFMICNVFLGPQAYYKNIDLFNISTKVKLFYTLGIHPHDAKDVKEQDIQEIEKIIKKEKNIKAIGEIGLDFYRNLSSKEDQFKVFKDQLKLAKDLDFPVVIHSRDADNEVLKILLDMGFKGKKVLWHCFTRNKEFAEKVLSCGWYVSIPGVITYKNATAIQEAIKFIPDDKILIESDSPFLSPVPFRGKTNEPAYIVYTASKIAELKEVDLNYLWEKVSTNTLKFFEI